LTENGKRSFLNIILADTIQQQEDIKPVSVQPLEDVLHTELGVKHNLNY